MAVYQIFSSADATLYSQYPEKNTGRDSILEVSVQNNLQDQYRIGALTPLTQNPYYTYDMSAANGPQPIAYTAYYDQESGSIYYDIESSSTYYDVEVANLRRSVLQFSPLDLAKLKNFASQSVSGAWEASLVMYLASAQNLNTTYSLDVYALTQPWAMGTGTYAQTPESQNGVSWIYTGPYNNSPQWNSEGGSYNTTFTGSQFFDYMSDKDINMNITDIVNGWFTGSIPNYGIIVKHPDYIENNTASFIDLKFFSVDTHTIYPPTIQFKWDDAYYNPPISASFVTNDSITVTLANNPGEFVQNEVYKMATSVRLTYPPRSFSTSSVYLNQLFFTENTCWALQDVKTNEFVINFDPIYTALSADTNSNYFMLYTSGLEVNRFYRILIQTTINSSTYGPPEVVTYTGQNLIFKVAE